MINFRRFSLSFANTYLLIFIDFHLFLDPQKDPQDSQMEIWRESLSTPQFYSVEKAKFILQLIGDQFCDMVSAELKAVNAHLEIADTKTIVWKPAVKGVREMCDTCKTTLFNYHWTCGR